MAHAPERKEKNCLNCGAQVLGRYCQQCGQENVYIKAGFWPMARHFVYDIFHFEGSFFTTLGQLIRRPGKVASDYTNGKRASYLDPVRMYLFLSAITFILLPLFINLQSSVGKLHIMATPVERLRAAGAQYEAVKDTPQDTAAVQKLQVLLDSTVLLQLKPASDTTPGAIDIPIDGTTFKAIPVEETVAFPGRNWFEKRATKKMRAKYEKEGEDLNKLLAEQNDTLMNLMPYLLFLSLPLFSLILKGLYKRNKSLYYSDHAIFTLYHYIVAFALLLVAFCLALVVRPLNGNAFLVVYAPAIALLLVYLLLAMKRFYKECWGKTFVKFLVLSIASLIAVGLLFGVFVLLTTLV